MALFGRKERTIATASSLAPSRLKVTRLMEPTRTCFEEMGLTHIMVGSQSGVSSNCLATSSKQCSTGALMTVVWVMVVARFVLSLPASTHFLLGRASGPSSIIRRRVARLSPFFMGLKITIAPKHLSSLFIGEEERYK